MQDLKEVTHITHYENFRRNWLNMMARSYLLILMQYEIFKGEQKAEESSESDLSVMKGWKNLALTGNNLLGN